MDTPARKFREKHQDNLSQIGTPVRIPASPYMKQMGFGTCVNVYRLDRPAKTGQGRSPWAIKRVSKKAPREDKNVFNDRIRIEAEILRKLSHPNIVGFRDAIKAENGVETLALELCSNSLGAILEERFEEDMGPLEAEYCIKFIVDIAKALDYLHTVAKLLHGDLKSHNILVNGEFDICKLCDFGVSLPLDENGEVNFIKNPALQYIGTPIWTAPEILQAQDVIDAKADIFSFGLVIYETLALVPPHTLNISKDEVSLVSAEGTKNDSVEIAANNNKESVSNAAAHDVTSSSVEESLIEEGEVVDDFDPALGTRPPLPNEFEMTDEYNRIVEIFYCCSNYLPEDRPTANVIWKSFE